MAISDKEKEKAIVKNVENLTNKLNEQFLLAAESDIEVCVNDEEIGTMGQKAKRIVLDVRLLKIL